MKTITEELDVRIIAPAHKHRTIFEKFDALNEGEGIVIINDHDPKPLYYQLLGERGNVFSWQYLQEGPEVWKVEITKKELTVGEIAAHDQRKIKVFAKYGIDFCCGGNKTLKQVCEEKQLSYEQIVQELSVETEDKKAENFNTLSLSALIRYIVDKHHAYVRETSEILVPLAEKVAQRHGDNHPELYDVRDLFKDLSNELYGHMLKEENILFPYIEQMEKTQQADAPFGTVQNPIRMMHYEHDKAGDLIHKIERLTRGFTSPADACNSYTYLYQTLKEYKQDLMQHIHLENNILFPRAIEMENQLSNKGR